MKIQLDHINMTVSNINISKQWYENLFGFQCVESGIRIRENQPVQWVVLKKDETLLCLYEYPNNSLPLQSFTPNHRIYHFGIRILDADISKWEQLIQQHKIQIEEGDIVDYPNSRTWYVRDPSGHEIEVSHWPKGLRF